MLDFRRLSCGSASELKSATLIPPLSDRLFMDSLKLAYFSRFFSRFDLSKYRSIIRFVILVNDGIGLCIKLLLPDAGCLVFGPCLHSFTRDVLLRR